MASFGGQLSELRCQPRKRDRTILQPPAMMCMECDSRTHGETHIDKTASNDPSQLLQPTRRHGTGSIEKPS